MLAALLLYTILGLAAPGRADPIALSLSAVPLNPEAVDEKRLGELIYLAGFRLDSGADGWGGFSAMLLSPDGERLLAASDFGHWLALRLTHDARGVLTGVADAELWPMIGLDGEPIAGKAMADAESLARDDGAVLVAFEREHRVWRYPAPDGRPAGRPEPVTLPEAVARQSNNDGIEALSELPGGGLLLLSEEMRYDDGTLHGWLRAGGTWSDFRLVPTGAFRPTGLSLLGGRDLLLLERRYTPIGGPAARLSVIPAAQAVANARLSGRELAQLLLPRTVDNFEGIGARETLAGVLIYILSDDNRNPLQRTLLLQFLWPRP